MTTISSNYETLSKDDFVNSCIDRRVIYKWSVTAWCLDISLCLRDDSSINLELLEILIEYLCSIDCRYLFIVGVADYIEARKLPQKATFSSLIQEEKTFILKYLRTLSNQYNNSYEMVIDYELTNTQ